MRRIYAQAQKVLVLDSHLQAGVQDPTPTDLLMRIRASTWSRRLWTFHEAGLAKELQYQFPQSAWTFRQICKQYEVSLRKNDNLIVQEIKDHTSSDAWSTLVRYPVRDAKAQKDPATLRTLFRISSLDPLGTDNFSFITEIEDFASSAPKEDFRRLAAITLPLRWRRTSRPSDEPICLAGLLGRDPKELGHLSATQKMMKVIGGLDSVPTDILFVEAPRIQEVGSRWLPATFLDRGTKAAAQAGRPAMPSSDGLLVRLFGIILREQAAFDIRQDYVHVDRERKALRKNRKQYICVGINDIKYKVEGVNLQPDNTISWTEYSNKKLAIILKEPLADDEPLLLGVLVTIRKSENQTCFCQHEHVVKVWRMEEIDLLETPDITNTTVVEAEYTACERTWCVG